MFVSKAALLAASLVSHMKHNVSFSSIAFFHGKLPKRIVCSSEQSTWVSILKVSVNQDKIEASESCFDTLVKHAKEVKGCVSVTPYGNPEEKDFCMYYIEWVDQSSCKNVSEIAKNVPEWGKVESRHDFPLLGTFFMRK